MSSSFWLCTTGSDAVAWLWPARPTFPVCATLAENDEVWWLPAEEIRGCPTTHYSSWKSCVTGILAVQQTIKGVCCLPVLAFLWNECLHICSFSHHWYIFFLLWSVKIDCCDDCFISLLFFQVVQSLLDMTTNSLQELACDMRGCHVISAYFGSKFVGAKNHEKLLNKFKVKCFVWNCCYDILMILPR